MENKKVSIILIVILSLLVVGLGGYIVYDKILTKENEAYKNIQQEIKDKDLIYQYETTAILNNVNHKLTYEYYYEKETDVYLTEIPRPYYYRVKVKIKFDNKTIDLFNYDFSKDYNFYRSQLEFKTAREIENHLYNDEIKQITNMIINASSKDYLLINLPANNPRDTGLRLMLDNKGELVYSFEEHNNFVLNETVSDFEKFDQKDYYFENGILYHMLWYQPQSVNELESEGLYIYEVNLNEDLKVTKRYLDESAYEQKNLGAI